MYSEHFTEESLIVDMQAAMGFTKTKKQAWRKMLYQLYFLSKSWLSLECFLKDDQNVLKRNRLVACHTDSFLIISIEINIIKPDLNQTYEYCVIFTYIILVYVTENIIQLHVIT